MRRTALPVLAIGLLALAVVNIVVPFGNPLRARIYGSSLMVLVAVVVANRAGLVRFGWLRSTWRSCLDALATMPLFRRSVGPASAVALALGLILNASAGAYEPAGWQRGVGQTLVFLAVIGFIVRAAIRRNARERPS